MSQAGFVTITSGMLPPQVPTSFVTNLGIAIPVANVLNILGTTVAAGSIPFEFTGLGNTVTGEIQISQAIAGTDATKVGLSSFNSAQFSVDANGFVSLVGGGGSLNTLTGNTGGAISPVAGNINTFGSGSITITGAGNTLTTQLTGLTNHAVLVGAGTDTITNLAIGTTGQVLTGVTGADPIWASPAASTITLTGTTGGALGPSNSFTLLGGTVAAGTVPVAIAGVGTTLTTNVQISQALAATDATKIGLSNFNSAQFSVDANGFVSASGTGITTTLTGNSGVATPAANNINVITANSTVKFTGSGATLTQDFGISNLILGSTLPALAGGLNNVSVGNGSLNSLTTSTVNCIFGNSSGALITTSSGNVSIGNSCLQSLTTGAAGVGENNVFGNSTLINLQTGQYNIAFGTNSGNAYTTSESSNLLIRNIGVVGESNVIRIGTQGAGARQQNRTFVAGIVGVTVANTQMVSIDSTTGQLGVVAATTLVWSVITIDQTALVNNGYICNKASALLLTLPATAAIGDIIKVTGINTALGWKIVQNANQQIFFGNASTTLGATGFLQSAATRDSVELVCVVSGASTVYNVISSVGNVTIA